MEFNADGTLKVRPKKSQDHLSVGHLLSELSFPVGKKLLIQVLRGEEDTRIKKLHLDQLIHFGTLGGYTHDELTVFIDYLATQDFLTFEQRGRFRVCVLTKQGLKELDTQEKEYSIVSIVQEHNSPSFVSPLQEKKYTCAPITQEDKVLFSQLDFFLNKFTDEQKKAIICQDEKQLCIAGAGSGKTAVLTHKIVYLVRFAGVPAKDILAITFTRKARREMINRLAFLLPSETIRVETFNSFAEKQLLNHSQLLYHKNKRMASYKEFIDIVVLGLQHIGFDVATFLSHYFTPQERAGKEQRQLFFSFLYDFRAILESYMGHHQEKDFFTQRINQAKLSQQLTAQNLLKLASFVHETLEERSLRTFADQLVDVNRLYDLHTNIIPSFQWVLVDEYQDVNPEQLRLLEHLDPQKLFCVGDPRQSIFAWRGSHPGIIYDFIDEDTTVVELTTNFRSASQIISFSNQLIAQTNKGKHSFSPLQAHTKDNGRVFVTSFTKEQEEAKSIIQQIKELACQRNEIFILSRTNKGLEPYKQLCEEENIAYIMRTDEKKDSSRIPRTDEITLSTVHAIKGLEAEFVFVVGVNFKNYPCKSKDHRFVELLCTKNNYDQFEEERRLLYVACTRAKKELYLSYSLGLSPFITRRVLQESSSQQPSIDRGTQKKAINTDNLIAQRSALRRWRFLEAQQRNVPPYLIFTDKTLESLLELQPLSVDELLEVSGLGKRKVEEFGQDILHIMYA